MKRPLLALILGEAGIGKTRLAEELLGTVRTEMVAPEHPLSVLCHDMRRNGRLVKIELGRLDEPATTTLLTHITGQTPDTTTAILFT